MSGIEIFVMFIFLIPVYGLLMYAYKNPKDSYMIGRRWMYKEEPELSEDAIKIMKIGALVAMIIITLIVIFIIF